MHMYKQLSILSPWAEYFACVNMRRFEITEGGGVFKNVFRKAC